MLATLVLTTLSFQAPPPPLPDDEAWLQLLDAVRSIDGSGNNLAHPERGSADVTFARFTGPAYADGTDAPAGPDRPSARVISNWVCAQSADMPNTAGVTDFVWQWGQFLDHDLDETPILLPPEAFDVSVPAWDPWFDPQGTGTQVIGLRRSFYERVDGIREQVNEITAYNDASNVYGSDAERARALRTLDGSGRLKTSAGGLLPFNEAGLPNAPAPTADFFLAGDFRANEQVGLTAMHTLFVREHNFWAERLAERFSERGRDGPGAGHGGHSQARGRRRSGERELTGDELYELARCIVAAEMQAITYREFLPVLLGPGALAPYLGYRDDVDASIRNEFATAAYRFGHSMLSPRLLRVDRDGDAHSAGHLSLAEAFFAPQELVEHGIDPLLRGLARQPAQEVDAFLVDEVRNFLFGPPGAGGFDLASLNLQRGRDHGLPGYNQMRRDLGLSAALGFDDITSDPELRRRLSIAYGGDVELVDPWVGGLCEDARPGALVGELVHHVLRRQFELLRDGDRFWYRSAMPPQLVQLVEQQTLARIVRRNTGIGSEFPDDPFRLGGPR